MRWARWGYSLVEVMVLLAILALLMSLLLPAVQRVREAANRLRCSNNLRQIGIALHSYHGDHGSFPPGTTSLRPGEPYPFMSWMTRILPYVEQGDAYRLAESEYAEKRLPFRPQHTLLFRPMPIYGCPSDERVRHPHLTHQGHVVALTSYLGVLGTAYDQPDGVLYQDSQTRLEDIYDGSSQTIVVGERPPSPDFWFGWWYAGFGQNATGSLDHVLGAAEKNAGWRYVEHCPRGPYRYQPGDIREMCDVFHFWSLHTGGAHFLFGDGAVRFLSYQAAPVLPALATRAGGETVSWP
jgi:prepilin-type processing-associated H-X9-DG protein